MTLRFINPYSSEWELAGSCRGSATRGRLSRSPFSVYKGKKISGQADVLWRVDGKICAGNLSRWETAPTEAKPNRGQKLQLIHNQSPAFGDPTRSLVTPEARRTKLCQACQQAEEMNSNESPFQSTASRVCGPPDWCQATNINPALPMGPRNKAKSARPFTHTQDKVLNEHVHSAGDPDHGETPPKVQ
jgi:hypothetical protein